MLNFVSFAHDDTDASSEKRLKTSYVEQTRLHHLYIIRVITSFSKL